MHTRSLHILLFLHLLYNLVSCLKMAKIVVVEPSIANTSDTTRGNHGSKNHNSNGTKPFYTRSITSGRDYVPEPFDSEKLPITLKSEIQRFLRVANLIDAQEPRVACLCRFHAFGVAHDLDRNSSGRGVRQFKTALLQRIEQDEEVTYRRRKEKSDVREVRRVYREYKDYVIKHGGESTLENRDALIKAGAIADVLYEVSNTLTKAAGTQTGADNDVKRSEFYDFNILPLDQGGVHQASVAAIVIVLGCLCNLGRKKKTKFLTATRPPTSTRPTAIYPPLRTDRDLEIGKTIKTTQNDGGMVILAGAAVALVATAAVDFSASGGDGGGGGGGCGGCGGGCGD